LGQKSSTTYEDLLLILCDDDELSTQGVRTLPVEGKGRKEGRAKSRRLQEGLNKTRARIEQDKREQWAAERKAEVLFRAWVDRDDRKSSRECSSRLGLSRHEVSDVQAPETDESLSTVSEKVIADTEHIWGPWERNKKGRKARGAFVDGGIKLIQLDGSDGPYVTTNKRPVEQKMSLQALRIISKRLVMSWSHLSRPSRRNNAEYLVLPRATRQASEPVLIDAPEHARRPRDRST
jgi:hypothetical protein